MSTQILVVAKAPVPGRVKTRLGARIGMQQAAEVAAAALLDTLAACTEGYGADSCHLALADNLAEAVHGDVLAEALAGWSVFSQRGDGFAERLANAHADLATHVSGAVLQIGMDTPQVTPADLAAAEADLAAMAYDGVLGPATDGGWWLLGLRNPEAASALREVAMSTPFTHDDTRNALTNAGLRIGSTTALRDVDTLADASAVAEAVPGGHFARAWRALT